jgi:DNA-binding CsgD family transcriptional regulator
MHIASSDVSVAFTGREMEVLELVAQGFSAKEIARKLNIAGCTVERHIENARLKTRTRNRSHLVAFMVRQTMMAAAA